MVLLFAYSRVIQWDRPLSASAPHFRLRSLNHSVDTPTILRGLPTLRTGARRRYALFQPGALNTRRRCLLRTGDNGGIVCPAQRPTGARCHYKLHVECRWSSESRSSIYVALFTLKVNHYQPPTLLYHNIHTATFKVPIPTTFQPTTPKLHTQNVCRSC